MTTKATFISDLAYDLGITKRAASEVFNSVATVLLVGLRDDGSVIVPGVGRLKVKARPSRMGRNPKTGDPVEIKARNVVKLSSSKLVKSLLNE